MADDFSYLLICIVLKPLFIKSTGGRSVYWLPLRRSSRTVRRLCSLMAALRPILLSPSHCIVGDVLPCAVRWLCSLLAALRPISFFGREGPTLRWCCSGFSSGGRSASVLLVGCVAFWPPSAPSHSSFLPWGMLSHVLFVGCVASWPPSAPLISLYVFFLQLPTTTLAPTRTSA